MELKRWRTRTWTISDEDGESATVRHRPLSHAWRERLVEYGIEGEKREAPADPEAVLALLREQRGFSVDLLTDLVIAVEGLTLGGEPLDTTAAIEALAGEPELVAEFLQHLGRSSDITPEQGKR